MNRSYNSENKARASRLRCEATRQEKRLWYEMLSAYRPRFIRQYMIGNYILDFYCSKARVAVELDGSQHAEDGVREYDEKRTAFLEDQGIVVLRYWNSDVNSNFTGVCEDIDRIVRERIGAEVKE